VDAQKAASKGEVGSEAAGR